MMERVIISSFDHESVRRVALLAPYVETAALFSTIVLDVQSYAATIPAKAIHVPYHAAKRKPVREAIEAGAVVRVYTVNDVEKLAILQELGVDAIFTDEPVKMLAALEKV